jgi:alkylated DNA repair dioxygenase AlkB
MGTSTPLPLSLFASGEPGLASATSFERTVLDDRRWVDVARGWVEGGDELLARLEADLPWKHGRRLMWGNWVDEPRLTCGVVLQHRDTPDILPTMAAALSARYGREFDACFCNLYRAGADSVAWHADRDGKVQVDPLVAIVSLGGPRQFSMRLKDPSERRGTRARSWTLHSGDLLVMGGSCQHRWEHAVPKVQHAPPRMSVTFRHRAAEPPGVAAAPNG